MSLGVLVVLVVGSVLGRVCDKAPGEKVKFTELAAPGSWLHLAGCSTMRQLVAHVLPRLGCAVTGSAYVPQKNDTCEARTSWPTKRDRLKLSACREHEIRALWSCSRERLVSFVWKNSIYDAAVDRLHWSFVAEQAARLGRTPTMCVFEAGPHEVDDTPYQMSTFPSDVPLQYLARAVARTHDFFGFVEQTYGRWSGAQLIWKTSNEFCGDRRAGAISFVNNITAGAALAAGLAVIDMFSVTGARNCLTDRTADRWHHPEHAEAIQLYVDRCLGALTSPSA